MSDNAIRMRPPNDYWGRRYGSVSKTGELRLPGRRASSNARSNSGPSGRLLRRGPRNYRNPKLTSISRRLGAQALEVEKKAKGRLLQGPTGR